MSTSPASAAPSDETALALAHLAAIVESSDDAIISKDLDGRILSWNRGAERLYGYTAEEAIGRSIYIIVPDDLRAEVEGFLTAIGRGERVDHHDTTRRRKDGRTVEVSLTISPVRDGTGQITSASVIARDITDRKRLERRLLALAAEDQLTGLANRRAFLRHLERHVDHCARYGWTGALIAIDVDNFKAVNDTLGHGAGDQLIKQTAHRLRRRLRKSDLIARLGGDEFVILLPVGDREAVEAVAASLAAELAAQEITIAGRRCATGSIGWALIDEAMTADEALIRVDLAAYAAKRSGGNTVSAYDAEADSRFAADEPFDNSFLLSDL